MQKIIRKALELSFPKEVNIDAVIDVINATPNPVIATEILTGVYEAAEVSEEPVEGSPVETFLVEEAKFYIPCTVKLDSYDKWTDTVQFHYDVKDTKSVYVDGKAYEAGEEINLDNYKDYEVDWRKEGCKLIHLETGKIKTVDKVCDLARWNDPDCKDRFRG